MLVAKKIGRNVRPNNRYKDVYEQDSILPGVIYVSLPFSFYYIFSVIYS